MHRLKITALALVLFVMLAAIGSAQAMLVRLPGNWEVDIQLCQDGFLMHVTGEITNNGVNAQVSVVSTSIPGQTGEVLNITATSDNFPVDVSRAFFWDSPQAPGTVVTNIRMDRFEDGVLLDVRDADAPDTIGDCWINPPSSGGGGVFLGDPKNLVLIPSATGIYDAPNGNVIGTMGDCKTAFVIESQDGFYRIAVMGGWISVDATWDVSDDYGQPGGASYAPCEGR